jgi:O-antigen/teichoic acid export membrane protein
MVIGSIIAAMGMADLGIGNGLMNAISEAYGKDDHRLARECMASAFVMMSALAVFLAVAGAIAYRYLPWMRIFNVNAPPIAAEGAKAFGVLYAWFVISIPLGVVARAQAGLQKGYLAQVIAGFGSLATLGALLGAIALHCDLPWLVVASTVGTVIGTLVNCWILFREYPWMFPDLRSYRSSTARRILKLGLLFFVLQCAVTIGYTSDNIVIGQVMGAAAVAAYAVPQRLFSVVSMVVSMGNTPLWPAYGEAMARGDVAWVRRIFIASLRVTLAITVPVCTVLVLAGRWIIKIFVGNSLGASLPLLIALGVWCVVGSISNAIAMVLNGAGVLRALTITSVFASLTNLALSIELTRHFGTMGVCLGSAITQLCITFPVCFVLIRGLFKHLGKEVVNPTYEEQAVKEL